MSVRLRRNIEGEPQISKTAVNPDEEAANGGEQIKGTKTEDSTIKEGTITYDIRFYAATAPQSGEMMSLIINIEAQNDFYPGYPIIKRGIYYCRKKIYSIWEKILQDEFDIKMTKIFESEVQAMCNLSEGVEKRGIQRGIMSSIQNLMESMGWSAEQAMTALKIPEAEQIHYIGGLKK